MTESKITATVQGAVVVLLERIYGEERHIETDIDWQIPEIQSALEDTVSEIKPDAYKSSSNLHDALVSGNLSVFAESIRDVVLCHWDIPSRRRNPQKTTGDSSKPTLFDGQETEQEKLYRELVNLFIERELINRPNVKAFRHKLNGGGVLSETDASNLLANELAGIVTFEDCERHRLSPGFLTGIIVNCLSTCDGGTVHVASHRHWLGSSPENFQFDLSILNEAGAEVLLTITHPRDTYKQLVQRKYAGLTYVHTKKNPGFAAVFPLHEADRNRPETWREVSGYDNSIIGLALDITADISTRLQWAATESLFWLLTGKLPDRSSIYGIRWPLFVSKEIEEMHPSGRLITYPPNFICHGPGEIIVQPWVHSKSLEAFFSRVFLPDKKALPPPAALDLFRRIQAETSLEQEPAWEAFIKTASFAEWKNTYESTTQSRGAVRTTYKRVEENLQRWLLWLVPLSKHSSR